MKLSRFIEILQEEDINKDLEVNCGISIDPKNNRIWFPEPTVEDKINGI